MVIHKILIICFFFSFQTFLFHMVKIISWPLLPLDTYRYILWFYVELYCIVLACPWYNLVGSLCLDTPSFAVKQKWKWHIILDLFWLSPTWHTVDLIAHLQVKPPSVFFAAEYSPDPSPPSTNMCQNSLFEVLSWPKSIRSTEWCSAQLRLILSFKGELTAPCTKISFHMNSCACHMSS